MKRCLAALLLFPALAFSQADKANLDFEEFHPGTTLFTAWQTPAFSWKPVTISPDSSNKKNGRYSLRIAYDPKPKRTIDGQLLNHIPLDVQGTTVTITCFAKVASPGDSLFIYCQAVQDRALKKMVSNGTNITSTAWTLVSLELDLRQLQQPLSHITIGAWLRKPEGGAWLDDFHILVDGRDLNDLRPLSSPVGETVSRLNPAEGQNLDLLCRVWGFLKYFHPQVAKGHFSWDFELLKMIPPAKTAPSRDSLSRLLTGWINSLGPLPDCGQCQWDSPDSLLTYNIDLTWMKEHPRLTPELAALLRQLFAVRHKADGHYASYQPLRNLNFLNEANYKWREMDYPREAFRLLFLFRYWNIIHYFFPYKNIIGQDWNGVLTQFLPRFAEAPDALAYHTALNQLVNCINDSHSGFYDPVLSAEYGRLYLPVLTTIVNNKAVVKGYYNDSLARADGWQRGDVIEALDGTTVKAIIDRRLDLVSGSNYPTKIRQLQARNFVTGGRDSTVTVQVRRDGRLMEKKVRRYQFPVFGYRASADTTAFKILDGNIGYVNMGLLERKGVDSLFTALKETRAILFDLRNYPRGTVGEICRYLYEKPLVFAHITIPRLEYPGAFSMRPSYRTGPNVGGNEFLYKGRVLILVNENTQSQAEWTTMAIQQVPGSLTIGSQTSGADGDASAVPLPGGFSTSLTGLGVFYPDGRPTQRVGVKVDVEVRPTEKGIKEGRDEVLEKAIRLAKE